VAGRHEAQHSGRIRGGWSGLEAAEKLTIYLIAYLTGEVAEAEGRGISWCHDEMLACQRGSEENGKITMRLRCRKRGLYWYVFTSSEKVVVRPPELNTWQVVSFRCCDEGGAYAVLHAAL